MSNIEQIRGLVGEFIDDTNICDKKMKKMLSLIGSKDLHNIMMILTGQKSIMSINPYYSVYRYDLIKNTFSHHLDVTNGDWNGRVIIQYDQNNLLMNMVSVESMYDYLSDVSTRYVFFSATLESENKKVAHMACLIVDRLKNEAYFYDPNGSSTFFNSIFVDEAKKQGLTGDLDDLYFDGSTAINNLFVGYFKDINDKVGLNIKFVPSTSWNPKKYVLNPSFDKNVLIGSGHCVITTILFMHLLNSTSQDINVKDITTIFNMLGSLEDDELIYIINGYSCGIYNIMRDVFDEYMQNDNYKKIIDSVDSDSDESIDGITGPNKNKDKDTDKNKYIDDIDDIDYINDMIKMVEDGKITVCV